MIRYVYSVDYVTCSIYVCICAAAILVLSATFELTEWKGADQCSGVFIRFKSPNSLFSFPVWSSFPCYLLHFGAKISDLQACCILERKSPICMTTCLAFGFWLWLLGFGFLALASLGTWLLAFVGFCYLWLAFWLWFHLAFGFWLWLLAFVVFCFWFTRPLYLKRTSVECMCSSIAVCI